MNGLGVPLEERKKAYLGHTKDDLIAKYNDARQKGDLPTMIALLDIIKAAPAGMKPPASTVEQDIMAMAQPAQAPAGFEGAVGAMENQAPMPQTGLPQTAANGGVMNFDDEAGADRDGQTYAKGGPVRMQAGMLATSTAPLDLSTASLDDLFRFAQYGDKDAVDEINRRGANVRQGMGYKYTPMADMPKPGAGVGSTSPQTTDVFRTRVGPTPLGVEPPGPKMGPAKIFPTQTSIPTGTGATASTVSGPTMGAPRAFPGQNVPPLGTPGVTPGTSATPPGAAPGAATAAEAAEPAAAGVRSLAGRAWDFLKKGTGFVGKAGMYGTLFETLGGRTPLNVGEEDILNKTRLFQESGKNLSEADRKLAQHFMLQPSMSYAQFKDRFFPAPKDTGETPIPSAIRQATTNANMPAFPQSALDMLRPRSTEDIIKDRNAYEKALADKGEITTLGDINRRLEEFRTEAGRRKETDIEEAKKGFTEDLLWTAALSAPQALRGRGLAQGVARMAESAMPMIMKAAEKKGSAIREAIRSDRDSKDKFALAQIDMEKANRSERLGVYDKAESQRLDSVKTYASAVLDKYKTDALVQAHLGGENMKLVSKQFDLAEQSLNRLYMSKQFKDATPEMQREMIRMQVQQFFAVKPGARGGYPPIQNVPNPAR